MGFKTTVSKLFTAPVHECRSGLAKPLKQNTVALVPAGSRRFSTYGSEEFFTGRGVWLWFRRHKFLGFTLVGTLAFGSLQWVPVSDRFHLALSSDKLENMIGGLAYERVGQKNKRRILGPESQEAVRVTRVMNEILHATNQALGLQNGFQVSVYEPREELKDLKRRSLFDDRIKFPMRAIKYHLKHPNKLVEKKPRKVSKLGFRYGTEHFDGLKWEVMVVDIPVKNASYAPNGRLIFYTGWFRRKDFTDADLAVILAHEVGHGLARHTSEGLLSSLWITAGIITAQLPDNQTIEDMRTAVEAFFSRRKELEADRIGLMLMAAAGYDPRRAPMFQEKFGNVEQADLRKRLNSTHPDGRKRARKLREDKVMKKAIDMYDQVQSGMQPKSII